MEVGDWEGFLTRVHKEGVDGIEVFYPYTDSQGSSHVSPAAITALAKKHGFLFTGGSDDHGPSSVVKEALGMIRFPYYYVEAMKRPAGWVDACIFPRKSLALI